VRDFYGPPGFWLLAVPILLVGILLFVLPFIRSGMHDIARTAPAHSLVGIQALRLAAIGTLIKTINGEFPLHVELAIGLTDIAFGLSDFALSIRSLGPNFGRCSRGLAHDRRSPHRHSG
jgi:hypothetical protein